MIDYFKGKWALHRRVSDGTYMQGNAILTPHSTHTLHYNEQGHFHTPTGVFEFFQHYLFCVTPHVNNHSLSEKTLNLMSLSLYFLEKDNRTSQGPPLSGKGRLFMTFNPKGKGLHTCKNDVYKGFFHHDHDNAFQLSFDVKGPRKNYSIITYYMRC